MATNKVDWRIHLHRYIDDGLERDGHFSELTRNWPEESYVLMPDNEVYRVRISRMRGLTDAQKRSMLKV